MEGVTSVPLPSPGPYRSSCRERLRSSGAESGGLGLQGRFIPAFNTHNRQKVAFQHAISSTSRPVEVQSPHERAETDPDYKLPERASLVIILLSSALLQVSFFIIVSSANAYAEHLGGSSTFSGLVNGIPTALAAIALVPLTKLDQGGYKRPLHFACASSIVGHVLYALAYHANFLYLILIGRMVNGLGLTMWMYSKRYCSDPHLVGVRRRTMLAGWLVVGQATGMSVGPFLGGVFFRVGFRNSVFNGFTSPAWMMAVVWLGFWVAVATLYEEAPGHSAIELLPVTIPETLPGNLTPEQSGPKMPSSQSRHQLPTVSISGAVSVRSFHVTPGQWGVIACMCWYAMTCFFILGAWESNIPVYGASTQSGFHWSPFAAGNFIALGGLVTFPFLFVNLYYAPRTQDRHILAVGSGVGLAGLLIMVALLLTHNINYGSFFICWWMVALGFNLASTVTLSLLSKQLPGSWNGRTSLAVQYSNYIGRVTGAVWGGSGVKVGMLGYAGFEVAILGVGALMFLSLWRDLKAKTG